MTHEDSESFNFAPDERGFLDPPQARLLGSRFIQRAIHLVAQDAPARHAGRKYCVSTLRQASRALPFVLILCSVTCARADLIIGNLWGGNNGTNSFSTTAPTQGWANSFTMGSSDYSLTSIQIVLAGMPGLSSPVFQLESDNGAPSNNVLLSLINPTFGSGIQAYVFTPATSFTLAANTTYWLTGTSTSTVLTRWEDSIGNQIPIGAGATYGGRDASLDGVVWGGAPGNTDLFEVDGTLLPTSVPEPGSARLAALGLALLFLPTGRNTWTRRRLRMQAAATQ